MKRLTNGFELFDNMGLKYNLSSQKDPFVFESLPQAPDEDQILIDPEEFRISDLKKLLAFGIYREEDKSQADYDDLFRDLGHPAYRVCTSVANENQKQESLV